MESRMAHNHSPVCRPLVMGISCAYILIFNGHNLSRDEVNGMESRLVNKHHSM